MRAAIETAMPTTLPRIESVAKVEDGSLRVLDLAEPAVRADVLAFQGGKVTALYQSQHSRPYAQSGARSGPDPCG